MASEFEDEAVSEELAPDDQQEDGSDFGQDFPSPTQAVVTATDWTTQTVLLQLSKGNIELNPAFQRRDAWKNPRKSRFIESLVLGIPIPQLVLAERKDRRNAFVVIDGKQRLLALRQFCSAEDDPDYKRFPLGGLDIKKRLNGVYYSQMAEEEKFDQEITNFENQPIRTVVIRNWPDEKFLYQVFLRLNTGSVPLSPQELRQALQPGPFSSFVDSFSASSDQIRTILGLTGPDFRMRDAELVIRYFAFRNFLHDYKGNLAPLLDLTTANLNDYWMIDDGATCRCQATDLEDAIAFTRQVFGVHAFRKWSGRQYERPLNRAVFDIMILFFDRSDVRAAASGKERDIERQYKILCQNDNQFMAALEGTTKSIDAIYIRLSRWARKLAEVIGGDIVRIPSLYDGKINL